MASFLLLATHRALDRLDITRTCAFFTQLQEQYLICTAVFVGSQGKRPERLWLQCASDGLDTALDRAQLIDDRPCCVERSWLLQWLAWLIARDACRDLSDLGFRERRVTLRLVHREQRCEDDLLGGTTPAHCPCEACKRRVSRAMCDLLADRLGAVAICDR